MFSSIKAVTYNCKNVKTSIDEIRELCQDHDVILLQETSLFDSELPMFSQLDCHFLGQGLSAMNTNNDLLLDVHMVG